MHRPPNPASIPRYSAKHNENEVEENLVIVEMAPHIHVLVVGHRDHSGGAMNAGRPA